MIELKFTGNDHNDIYNQLLGMGMLMAQGMQNLVKQQPIPQPAPAERTHIATSSGDVHSDGGEHPAPVSEVVALANPTASEAPPETQTRRRTRQPKPVVEGKAETTEVLTPVTPEAIKGRVQQILEKHAARGNARDACIQYVLKLYEPFGIKKNSELKAEQYAEFWKASEAYLNGTA